MRAPSDGYTLLMVTASNAINATLYEKLNFNFIRDIAPIAGIDRVPMIMAVNPSVPAKTVPEFIAYATANPGKINMASAGNGTTGHVCGELFKVVTGVNMVHVPYRGDAPALTDLLGGQVQVMFPTAPASIEYIRAGTLRSLAVTTATRSEALPDIPNMGEFLPGYEASSWYGVGAPKATPSEVTEKLNKGINAALADPKFRTSLPTWAVWCFPVRLPTSGSSSPMKPRSGARSFGRHTSRQNETGRPRTPRQYSVTSDTRTHRLVLAGGRLRNAPPGRAHHGPPDGP